MIGASEEARLRTRLRDLERLAANPGTDAEGENAKRRIGEIEEKLARDREERTQVREIRIDAESGSISFSGPTTISDIAKGVTRMGKRKKAREAAPSVREDWPFGWSGPRNPVEHNAEWFDDQCELEWKCTGCGDHITLRLSKKMIRKMSGQRGGAKEYVRRRVGGSMNLLCNDCWTFWENK